MYIQWNTTQPHTQKKVSFKITWMDLEGVIQSEASQKEKNKYCLLTHIYGI